MKTVLLQTIQFSISTHFHSFLPMDRILSAATTPGQIKPGSDGNEGVICIPKSSWITGASPSDCLASYPEQLLGESYSSTEMQSAYTTVPADSATLWFCCKFKFYPYLLSWPTLVHYTFYTIFNRKRRKCRLCSINSWHMVLLTANLIKRIFSHPTGDDQYIFKYQK